MILREAEKISGCPALPLAVEGWSEILRDGHGGDAVSLQWDQSVIWIEENGIPCACIVWQKQEWRNEVWISHSYVKPEYRRRGLFRQMYARLIEIAREKKVTRIAGGISTKNAPMMLAAAACGRGPDYVVYSQTVSID